jgi:drug/metabolite transporter (DMT)-like permease
MLAIGLALGSSLVYGVSDFLGGLKSRSTPLLSVLLVSQGSALMLLAVIVAAAGEGPPDAEFLVYAALAGLAEAVGVAALYRGLAAGTMSIVAPVAATAPAVPVVAAIALGELPEPLQGFGIALALAGVAIISLQPGSDEAPGDVRQSVVFGALTALGFGSFLVAMDAASEGSVQWALLVARLTAVTAFAAVFLARRPALGVAAADLPVLVLIGALIIGADAMFAVASTEGLLSVVAVLSSLYPVVTIALARLYLNERIAGIQRVGVAAALIGATAISAS